MRKCPKCGKTYDDTWKVCLSCSVALSDNLSIVETNPELGVEKSEKIPIGIETIIVIFSLQAFVFIILWALPILNDLIRTIGRPDISAYTRQSQVKDFVFMVIAASIGIWCIIVAIWLSKRKKIGLYSAMITFAISLLLSGLPITGAITSGMPQKYQMWVGISTFVLFFVVTYGGCLYYLTRPKVKEQFKKP